MSGGSAGHSPASGGSCCSAVLLAGLAGVAVVINERDQRTYVASTRLLVTSSEAPYYRIGTTDFVEAPQPAATEGDDAPTRSAPVLVTDTPDTDTLIQAANLYPLLIESDQVDADARADVRGAHWRRHRPRDLRRCDARKVRAVGCAGDRAHGGVADRWRGDRACRGILQGLHPLGLAAAGGGGVSRKRSASSWSSCGRRSRRLVSGATPITLVALVALAVMGAFIALAVALDRIFPRKLRPEPVAGREAGDRARRDADRGD